MAHFIVAELWLWSIVAFYLLSHAENHTLKCDSENKSHNRLKVTIRPQ